MPTVEARSQGLEPADAAGSEGAQQGSVARATAPSGDASGASFPTPVALVPDALSCNAKWHGRKTALVCGDRRPTWSELNARANRVANALLRLGIRRGDRVGVLLPNSIEAAEVYCGVVKAGGVLVPLSAQVPAPGLVLQIADSDSRVLFVGAPLNDVLGPYTAALAGLLDGGRIAVGFAADGWRAYEALLDDASEAEPGVVLAYDDDFNIMYSSGTTGAPKGIVHTHFARLQTALDLALGFRISFATVGILATPLYSNAAWIVCMPTLVAGGTVVVMPRFDPREFLELVQRERVTHAFMVPTQYGATMALPDFERYDLSSLQLLISAGSPLLQDVKERIVERFGCPLSELYGLTEGVGTILPPEMVRQKPGSVGVPLLGWDIRIIDNEGRELPRGEIGEIVGYATVLMRGYHKRPEQTAEAVWTDERGRRYLRTGDVGRLDADGYLYVLDRKKDMLISGGQNVYPVDLEAVVARHPAVAEVAVIGVPHPKWGETPLALVVRRPGAALAAEELRAWANPQLATYQRLSAVEFRDTLPRNQLGKVLKRELREPYWGGAR
jgi:acyl-CoA synthetase (AMP-forming)/AMP-acid ligase II